MKKTIMILLAIGIMACNKKKVEPATSPTYNDVRVVCKLKLKYYNITQPDNRFDLFNGVLLYNPNPHFTINYSYAQATNKLLVTKDTIIKVDKNISTWKITWTTRLGLGVDSSFMNVYVNNTLKSSQIATSASTIDINSNNTLYYNQQ